MSARSGAVGLAPGRRHPRDDRLEQLGHADALLGRDREDLLPLGPDQVHDLLGPPLRLGAGQVDLVEDRDDLEPRVQGQEEVAESVCAWTPCEASTTRIAPSHAASERDTS